MTRHTIYTLILLMAWLASFQSCTTNFPASDNTPLAGKGQGILQLSVPLTRSIPTTASTGSEEATADERRITSLWFMAYPTANDEGETLVKKLDTSELAHEYKTFAIKMKYGTYRIYVAANVPEILAGTTEEELKGIILKYKEGDAISLPDPRSANGLPMFYQKPEPYTLSSTQAENLLADLVYSCIKVRYTLVFDNKAAGISNPVFGTNVLKIDNVSVCNIADRAPLVPGTNIGSLTLFDTDASGAFNGKYRVGKYNADSTDEQYNKTTIEHTEAGQWAYRSVFYLPEHYVTTDTQECQTQMRIAASLYTAEGISRASLEYTIELGDTQEGESAAGSNVRQLPRGCMYDITGWIKGLGNKIETTATVQDWTLQTVDTQLNGPYYLYVSATSVELEAGKDVVVPCHTDASSLSYESPTYTLSEGGVTDIYEVEFHRDETKGEYTSFTERIHPNMPPVLDTETVEEVAKYFYIVAGGLKKKIDVSPLRLEPYLTVTPQNYTIYIKEISNQPTYAVRYTYRTNLPRIQIAANKDIEHLKTEADGTGFTEAKAFEGPVSGGSGILECTLDKPYISGNFSTSNTATYVFTTTGYGQTLTKSATLQIIPNATSYHLHFRPMTDDWINPHIYVYEPLYTPLGTEITIPSTPEGENAVLYGFTGKITFQGWTTQGGTVNNPVPDYLDKDGAKYEVETKYDPMNENTFICNTGIDYCPSFRTDCCLSGVNRKWPGVKMKVDEENPGWYYFDLPLLAEPGKALIMFADGHKGPLSIDLTGHYRYPAHMVPGVPLYNFADKDGWFLYDYTQSDKNEFVDDKPNVMDRTENLPDGTYRIWCKTNYTHIHIWKTNGNIYTNWDDDSGLLTDAGNGNKYFDLKVSSELYGNINYILHTGNDKTKDLFIAAAQWKTVTGKDFDYEVYL